MLVLAVIATVSFLYKMPSVFELQLDECGRLVATDLRQNSLYIIIYNTYGYVMHNFVFRFTFKTSTYLRF